MREYLYACVHYRIILLRGLDKRFSRSILITISHTLAVKPVADVSWKTGTREAAQRVGAVGEHVARPVLAFVLVCKQ